MTDIVSRVVSNYQALVVQATPHEPQHPVSASYTWSHALDNGVNGQTFNATNSLLDPFNLTRSTVTLSTTCPAASS